MPKKATSSPLPADGNLPYEAAYARLEALVDSLESGEVSLADMVAKSKKATNCSKFARNGSAPPN